MPLVVPHVGAANAVASRSAGDAAAVAVSPGVVVTDVVTHDVAAELSRAGRSGTSGGQKETECIAGRGARDEAWRDERRTGRDGSWDGTGCGGRRGVAGANDAGRAGQDMVAQAASGAGQAACGAGRVGAARRERWQPTFFHGGAGDTGVNENLRKTSKSKCFAWLHTWRCERHARDKRRHRGRYRSLRSRWRWWSATASASTHQMELLPL